ncbi:MAG: cytochrome c biogenesis protein CcdA [Synechococcaceae bacterium WBA_2_066]|nr:cytochrome c biogenesis protein CcdA [Synechococcaceae bacterium WB6_1A_059]NBP31898.1 cytochrome c biogenesis protein CcdA [Synechococcaceae bacterium WB6_1B_055]NBQ18235.1 cytochrome c biogenesis protein CcdA [Synechococcaceae bacterium WB5_2A_257]NBY59007.1 cytochrome c biogenesis protein CcdA [Synechococcaceae bacterium LLD_019]NCU90381.1 cytochrome c biogenesis protein CcdA [Synechococcaceae bacterium WB7_1B_046]NCY13891.1 cytochrome c biogenesis protein CcdA [Synechococcaceae bacteriu
MDLSLAISDLARASEQLLKGGLQNPGPGTFALVFGAGLLTSLGPCSLSLLPVSLAYLAGFGTEDSEAAPRSPWQRSFGFCFGVVAALVLLGTASALLGSLYGQTPEGISVLVALLSVLMGLNLLGLVPLRLPAGPDPERWRKRVPPLLAPLAAGLAFGLAASPCTTPVLAVLLAWIAETGRPLLGMALLACFGSGQVLPLLLAGTLAASLPKLLALRSISRWVPPISGAVLVALGGLSLLARL